jgi:hypothetical protein
VIVSYIPRPLHQRLTCLLERERLLAQEWSHLSSDTAKFASLRAKQTNVDNPFRVMPQSVDKGEAMVSPSVERSRAVPTPSGNGGHSSSDNWRLPCACTICARARVRLNME